MTEPAQAVRIRAAVPDDAEALAELHARSRAVYYAAGGYEVAATSDEKYRHTWRKMVADARLDVLVAHIGDDMAGVLTLDANGVFPTNAPHEKRVRLVGIFVEPGQWSRGVGSALMARFIANARQTEALGEVDVWERNSRAIQFYERHGWTRDGTSRPGQQVQTTSASYTAVPDGRGQGSGGVEVVGGCCQTSEPCCRLA